MSATTASNAVSWMSSLVTLLTFFLAAIACAKAPWFLPASLAQTISEKLESIRLTIERLVDQDVDVHELQTRFHTLHVRLCDTRLRINRAPGILQQLRGAVFKGLWMEIYRLHRDVNMLRVDVEIAFDEWHYSFTGGMLAGVPLQVLWKLLPSVPDPARNVVVPAHHVLSHARAVAAPEVTIPEIALTIV